MLVKPRITPGRADVRDLSQSKVVQWQRKYYFPLVLVAGLLVPWAIPGYLWGDWRGGIFITGFLRITAVHHVRISPFLLHYMELTFPCLASLLFLSIPLLIG